MDRSRMKESERHWRSRLCQWLRTKEVLHGTLAVRERVCGKSGCKCTGGQKHVSLMVVRSRNGKVEQLYVPREYEGAVRRWARQYQEIYALLEKVAEVYWDKVKRKEF